MESVRIMGRVDFSSVMGEGDFWNLPVYFETEKHGDGSTSVTFESKNNPTITNLFEEIDELEQGLMMDLINRACLEVAQELMA